MDGIRTSTLAITPEILRLIAEIEEPQGDEAGAPRAEDSPSSGE